VWRGVVRVRGVWNSVRQSHVLDAAAVKSIEVRASVSHLNAELALSPFAAFRVRAVRGVLRFGRRL